MRDSSETTWLVTIYKEYEFLWNANLVDYRDRHKRRAAESEIVSRIGIEGFGIRELRQKVKNIRCTYNQERKKMLKAQEEGSVYVSNLQWYKIMDEIMKRSKESAVEGPSAAEEVSNEQDNGQSVIWILDTSEGNQQKEGNSNGHPTTIGHSPAAEPAAKRKRTATKKNTVGKLKFFNRTILPKEQCNSGSLAEHNDPAIPPEPPRNDRPSINDAFAGFVAASLEHLPAEQALFAQQEIHGILMKYQLKELSSSKGDSGKSAERVTKSA